MSHLQKNIKNAVLSKKIVSYLFDLTMLNVL